MYSGWIPVKGDLGCSWEENKLMQLSTGSKQLLAWLLPAHMWMLSRSCYMRAWAFYSLRKCEWNWTIVQLSANNFTTDLLMEGREDIVRAAEHGGARTLPWHYTTLGLVTWGGIIDLWQQQSSMCKFWLQALKCLPLNGIDFILARSPWSCTQVLSSYQGQ